MSEKHKIGTDGLLEDGVRIEPLTTSDLTQYDQAQQALSQWTAPILLHAGDPHERLAIINVDGTGNDMLNDPEHMTNIGRFNKELEFLSQKNPHIRAIYEVGPGTQKSILVRTADGAFGYTYDSHIEHAYKQLIEQAAKWQKEDPEADIRIAITGFSRGGEQAAGLARLIHERGIQDPRGMVVKHHLVGPDTITFTKPPLMPPSKVMQAVVLLDPVGTGVPHRRDRQLPSSVVSGLQITARDERRDAFASSEIIPSGFSADGRFLQVTVPGAHSDIGGSYHRNGLATLNYNLAADYLNALSDTPLLHKQPLPQDRRMYVIHHSEDHAWFYATKYVTEHGERALRGAQRSAPDCRATIACLPPEPLDPSLAAVLPERQPVTLGLVPTDSAIPVMTPAASITELQQRLVSASEMSRPVSQIDTALLPHGAALGDRMANPPASSWLDPLVQGFSLHETERARATAESPGKTQESELSQRLDRMLKAAESGDWNSFDKDNQAFADMPPGRELLAQAKATVDMQERHALELAEQRQALEQQMMMQHSQQRSHGISR